MILEPFLTKYEGKGIDEDGSYGFQCVDLVMQYSKEVLGIPRWGSGNAIGRWENYPKDQFDRINNSPSATPQEGDIIIWGKTVGEFGHIAVFIAGNETSFTSFDQNYPLGSLCHRQPHSYRGVLGWLRFKHVDTPPPTDDTNDMKLLSQDEIKDGYLVFAGREPSAEELAMPRYDTEFYKNFGTEVKQTRDSISNQRDEALNSANTLSQELTACQNQVTTVPVDPPLTDVSVVTEKPVPLSGLWAELKALFRKR